MKLCWFKKGILDGFSRFEIRKLIILSINEAINDVLLLTSLFILNPAVNNSQDLSWLMR